MRQERGHVLGRSAARRGKGIMQQDAMADRAADLVTFTKSQGEVVHAQRVGSGVGRLAESSTGGVQMIGSVP